MTYLAIALVMVISALIGVGLFAIGEWMKWTERRLDALERSAPIEDTETEIPCESPPSRLVAGRIRTTKEREPFVFDEPVSDQFPVIRGATDLGRGMP